MPELAYVNGTFCRIEDAKVSIEDRGFQFGDGVYEVIVAYNGKLFLAAEHLRRLRNSAAAIRLEYDFDAAPIESILEDGLRRSELREAMIYVQLTRGVAPRAHAFPANVRPTLVMTFKPRPTVPPELRERGARVMTVSDPRWANCFIKAIILLPNVLAKNEALRQGFDEAVFVAATGEVRECTSSNIFLVDGRTVIIPPRDSSVLHGVTQGFLMECVRGLGLEVVERAFDVPTLKSAAEAFLSSTTTEVLGITQVDERRIGTGAVGPITRQIHAEFLRRTAC